MYFEIGLDFAELVSKHVGDRGPDYGVENGEVPGTTK